MIKEGQIVVVNGGKFVVVSVDYYGSWGAPPAKNLVLKGVIDE